MEICLKKKNNEHRFFFLQKLKQPSRKHTYWANFNVLNSNVNFKKNCKKSERQFESCLNERDSDGIRNTDVYLDVSGLEDIIKLNYYCLDFHINFFVSESSSYNRISPIEHFVS